MSAKLCSNCKWSEGDGAYRTCHAPQNNDAKLVGPDAFQPKLRFCNTQRSRLAGGWVQSWMMGTCGTAGRWFEPKEILDD